MNKIYKIVWNKARNCYVVASEFAKSHSQSNKRVRSMTAVVAAAMMLTGFGGMAIEAANPASGDTNITIGKDANCSIWNGQTGHDGFTSGYISIGENAEAWDGEYSFQDYLTKEWSARIGTKEYLLDFNQGAVGSAKWGKYRVTDGTKLAGAIAIGKNTMARTGSVTVGDYTYVGKLGDIEVDPKNRLTLNNGVYSTTLGASSYNSGSMSSVTGAFSIISHKEDKHNRYEMQNFGATVYGSLNSIESSSVSSHSAGMANSVLGFGNRTQNTNASLVWGTGNEVTNSIEDLKINNLNWNKTSASDAQKEIIKAMQSSDQYAGGSVMAIGGGNKADWAIYSQLLGVQNTLNGSEKDVSKLTMINGYKNTVTNAKNTTIIGSNNTATNIQSTIVMGDNNTLKDRENVISLGNNNTVDANDAVAIGNGTTVRAESGVAIGVGSVADRVAKSEKGERGEFAPDTIPTGQESTWTSTKGAVSVGDTANNITRQITNVAAGREDTDAVNVAQLKKVNEEAGKHSVVTEGANITVTPEQAEDGRMRYNVALNNNIRLSGDNDAFVNISGTNGTIETTGSITTKDRVYADKGAKLADVDITKDTLSNGPSKVVLNEGYAGMAYGNTNVVLMNNGVYLNGKVNVDKAGQIHNVTAGTADEDAVNVSQLNKATASSKTTVSKGTNTTVTSTVAEDGHTDYKVNLNKNLEGIESIFNGDAKINLNDTGVVISKGNDKTFSITDTGMGMSVIGDDYVERSIMVGKTGTVISGGLSVAGSKITNVAAGTDDTDAVNYGQLKKAVSEGNTDSHIKAGEYEVGADNKVSMDIVDKNGQSTGEKVTIKDVAKASDVGDVSKIDKDIQNIKGNTTVVDAVNNVNNKVGDLNYSQVAKGDLVNGDNTTTAIGKLNQKLSDVEKTAGAHSTVSTDDSGNISVTPTKDEKTGATDYKVSLNKDLKLDSVKVGENVSLTKDGLTAGDTKVTNTGLSIGDKTYVSEDGLNANNQTITNVANGKVEKGSADAVNGGQLYETNQAIANNATNISSLSHSISNLDNRVNKVGAGAAALAALHPLDFDPDAKWDFAAGYGNYRGANAAAVGAYYRPNEDTMFSVGGTFGNGENMVNAGVSFKLGSGSSHVSTSRVAMAKEIKELRGELEAMKSAMLDANAGKKIDTSKLQLFPDVPQNHWAYEYVAQLAGNGMIEGYSDGNFAGDRPMTRYEFAAILYRAMTKGAVLSDKILSEFSHELEYFTVDTIAKDNAGNPTIQRVRTVKENKNK